MNSNSHHPRDLCLVSPTHEFAWSAMEGHTNLSQSDRLLVLDTQGSCDQFGPRDSRGKEIILRLELSRSSEIVVKFFNWRKSGGEY